MVEDMTMVIANMTGCDNSMKAFRRVDDVSVLDDSMMASGVPPHPTFKIAALFFLVYGSWRWSAVSGTSPMTPIDMFEQWMAKHGRTYANESEKSYRLGVFTRNLDDVNAFRQAGNHSYTLGLNGFSDLTNEEFLATYTTTTTGPSPSEVSYPGLKPFRYANVNAPSSIDWREKGAVTEVKNQLTCGKDSSSSSCSSSIPIHLNL
ncbi:hypothetical protein GW17_00052113 [Ensete ventricosum]|nr:hypothetical protein GW17_00052113 [Ensete ventricosum]